MQRSLARLRPGHKHFGKLKFSSGGRRHSKETDSEGRASPTLIYVQNPIAWLINKIDFRMLKTAWDPEFDENEFKRGTKQAVSVITGLISENDWENLRGLVTGRALLRLKRQVETEWTDVQRRNVALEPRQLKLALPRRIRFSKIGEEKLVDVDSVFVGLKFQHPPHSKNLIFVESAARFHRNYSLSPPRGWTVSAFKITGFHVERERDEE